MKARLVFFLALVAVVSCYAAQDDENMSVLSKFNIGLKKAAATATEAQATVESKDVDQAVLLSIPQLKVDVDIKKTKEPVLSIAEAPCKEGCKDVCTSHLERVCLDVAVPTKHCSIAKKTMEKQFCEKKCNPTLKLHLKEVKIPIIKKHKEHSMPNPPAASSSSSVQPSASPAVIPGEEEQSSPPADVPTTQEPTDDARPNPSAPPAAIAEGEYYPNPSAPPAIAEGEYYPNPSAPPAIAEGEYYPNPSAPPATIHADEEATDRNADEEAIEDELNVDVEASSRRLLHKPDLDIDCKTVCVTVPYVIPHLECEETTETVRKCTHHPQLNCEKKCLCIPQKKVIFNLPKKPVVGASLSSSTDTDKSD